MMSDEMKTELRLEYYNESQDESGDILREYRKLWDEVFHDPEGFADYYFQHIRGTNKLLGVYMDGRLTGMLHMNPYTLRLADRTADCYYIVGVAVREPMRRQGVMRFMMEQALRDMKSENCPITFLMPKEREYYAGFGFETVYETKVLRIDIERLMKGLGNRECSNIYEIKSMSEYRLDELIGLSQEINTCLAEKYSFYVLRNISYMTEMFAEHYCQNGSVGIIREREQLRCVFSYDIYDSVMYVERFEFFDGNILHILREILGFAEEHGCGSIEITVPACQSACIEEGWQEYIRKGIIQLEEGRGIMALSLEQDGEKADDEDSASGDWQGNYLDKMKNVSFFDEIV